MCEFTKTGVSLSVATCKALLSFASKDDTRKHLWSVGLTQCLDDVTGEPYAALAATDGHTLMTVKLGGEPPSKVKSVFWPRDYVETQCKLASVLKGPVELSYDKLAIESSRIKYPPVSDAEPLPKMSSVEALGINPAYLARMTLAAKACGTDFVAMVTSGSPRDPMRFDVTGKTQLARITIMPRVIT